MVRLLVFALVTLLSSGCGRTEFAYRHADWLLEYRARQAVDVSAAQREGWQPVLASILRRHREEELPLIIAYLDAAAGAAREVRNSIGGACLVDPAFITRTGQPPVRDR